MILRLKQERLERIFQIKDLIRVVMNLPFSNSQERREENYQAVYKRKKEEAILSLR